MANDRFIDNENGTITDNQLKVIWKKTDSFQDTQKWLNWFKGQDYVEITNMERFAGFEDWRYPNEEEAWSLFDLSYRVFYRKCLGGIFSYSMKEESY